MTEATPLMKVLRVGLGVYLALSLVALMLDVSSVGWFVLTLACAAAVGTVAFRERRRI